MYAYWGNWQLFQKVVFDGDKRIIFIADGVTSIRIKEDVYSAWKEWMQLNDHAKFLPAIRSIGGDPIGPGQFAGDIYFLMNGWKLMVSKSVTIIGVLYDDNAPSPYVVDGAAQLVTNQVSQLVQTTTGAVAADTLANSVWAHNMAKKILTTNKFLALK